jgi:hypothetical protein
MPNETNPPEKKLKIMPQVGPAVDAKTANAQADETQAVDPAKIRDAVAESRLINALQDERYDWRTVGGLARALGMDESTVNSLLNSMPDTVVRTTTSDGRILFTTRNHYKRTHGLGDKLLSALADKVVA